MLPDFSSSCYMFLYGEGFSLKICSFLLQNSLDTLEKKNSTLELDLSKTQKDSNDSIQKLQEVEQKCSKLQQNIQRCGFISCIFLKKILLVTIPLS